MHSAARARSVMLPCGGALTAAPVSPRRADRSPDFSPTRRPLPIRFCQPARQPGAVPSHFYPHSLRHDAPVFPARCRALLPGFIPIPPRREKFSSPFHTARNNFLGKYKMDETFWAFRVSIYRGACDRDAWPSRRVRRAAPAAAGGSRRNGPARCLGGARTPAPAEETAAHAVKQTARYPRAKPKERIRQKWKDILCETSCTSYRNMLYYLHQKSACGGRRGGLENPFRRQPGGNRPPDRQNSSSTNTFSSNFPSPDRRRPEKQTAANRFPFLHLPRDGARTARGQSPHRRARPPQKVVMPMIVRK